MATDRDKQGDLLAFAGIKPPQPNYLPDPAKVRQELLELLAKARTAEAMPWPEREARMWRTVFPQMANWLPADEADTLRAEFAAHLARLS